MEATDTMERTLRERSNARPGQDAVCDVFVKLGGSILDHDDATRVLVAPLVGLARDHRMVILPGGGHVVKRIKAVQAEHASDFLACWRAAVLCADVNAGILAAYSRSFSVVACAADMMACFRRGNIGVFAPASHVLSSLELMPEWQPTTDSMGLYYAKMLGARRYVIVSDVDGMYPSKPHRGTTLPPVSRMSVDELEALPSSKLDPVFPAYFRRYTLPTYVVNGRYPQRVCAAVSGEATVGTEIVVSAPAAAGS